MSSATDSLVASVEDYDRIMWNFPKRDVEGLWKADR